jgi:predicted DNA-binding protein YlxM (UPF0122 family)
MNRGVSIMSDIDSTVKEISSIIHADTYGVDRDFIQQNSQKIKDISQSLTGIMSRYGLYDHNRGSNPIEELSLVVNRSVRRNLLPQHNLTENEDKGSTGFRSISMTGSLDANELDVINQSAVLYQNFFSTVHEYRNIVKLIPEIDRVIKIVVRDILNPSEITKRIFNHVYEPNKELSVSDLQATKINKMIQDNIIDPNDLEKRFKKWTYETAVCGAKPVAVIPYAHVLKQLQEVTNADMQEVQTRVQKMTSEEGFNFKVFLDDDEAKNFGSHAYESSFGELAEPDQDVALEEIVDDDLVDKYIESALYNERLDFEKRKEQYNDPSNLFSTEGKTVLDEFENHVKTREDWKKKLGTVSDENKRSQIRGKLKDFIAQIDDSIVVTRPESGLALETQKRLKRSDRYDAIKTPEKILSNSADTVLSMFNTDKKGKKVDEELKAFFGKDGLGADVSIMKEALIVEYAPDTVIPIEVNGQYVGFYAIEYEALYGPEWKSRRRTSSFTDFVSATGYRSDADAVSGTGPLLTTNANDPLDTSVFSPMSVFNMNAYKYTSQGSAQDDIRAETLKLIVLKILARRMHDPELIKNKNFKDAVMQLLRNDYITRKQIMFTFIPPENMVYMTWNEDENNVPLSIMDGTLLFCYMYLASVVSSLMIKLLKSADKEKLVYNVGMTRDVGLGIAEIQRNLSTRSIYSQNIFNNASSVLRNSGIYQRLVIPAFKGEQLYEVSQIERMNNLDPDDTFTDKLLTSVLSKLGVSPALLSAIDDADFAKTVMTRNLEYRNEIIERQPRFERYAKQLITLLTKYSSLPKVDQHISKGKEEKDAKNQNRKDDEFDLRINLLNIEPKFSAPTYLTLTTISDYIENANTTIDAILKAYNMDSPEPGLAEMRAKLTKRKLFKEFVDNVDWNVIDTIIESVEEEAMVAFAREKKLPKITDNIENGPSEGGGGESSGGGEFGGGEFGGGEDEFGGEGEGEGGGLGGDEGGGEEGGF